MSHRLLLRLVANEAVAYAKMGLLASRGTRPRLNHTSRAPAGVLFVHGLGANSTQFTALHRALATELQWFDAFEYRRVRPLRAHAEDLLAHIVEVSQRCERLLLVGHSLGGLLLRMVLQSDRPLPAVSGFVSICAPLHGSTRSRLSPVAELRELLPESELFAELEQTRDRLEPLRGSILTIGSTGDHFVAPSQSAFLEGHDQLLLRDKGHVASLFDHRVHRAISFLARRVTHTTPLPRADGARERVALPFPEA